MDVLQLLTDQHRLLEESLAAALQAGDPRERAALLAEAGDQLAVHVAAEEDVFYPAIRACQSEGLVLESLDEHLSLKQLLADLLELAPYDMTYGPKLRVLREQALHHHEEEEDQLFPQVFRCMDAQRRLSVGDEMLACQRRLLRAGQPRRVVAEQTARAAAL
jgi:hypothetical protein